MIYPKRYVNEPRKRKVYCDACDAIAVYGTTRENFRYKDVSRTEMAEIWNFAAVDMMGKGKYDKIYIYLGVRQL